MAVFTAIGSAVFGAGTFMAAATAAGLQLAAGLAFSLIGKSMQGEPEPPKFGVQGRLQAGEDVPRSINFGWNCTAGSLVYHNTFGAGGTFSARVIAIGDLPICSLQRVFVDGVASALGTTPNSNLGYPVLAYRKGGVDHLWVKFYDGTQTSADSYMVNTVGDAERPYGSDRVGRGVPYVIVFARAPERNDEGDKPLFQGIPELKFETYGVRWYNPAKDTTVGGSGSQRWDDPATWGGDEGDFNPVVQLYNMLRGVRYDGDYVYGMQALSAARLPVDNWIAGINDAQAAIAGPSGNEPTFRAGGEVQVGAQVATTVEALLTACNGRLAEVGGKYKIFVGAPGSPVMAFTDADILSTEEQSFTPFYSLADTVNGVDASFPNPGEGWNVRKAPPLLRPDLEALDGNRRLTASVALDLVPYKGQTQRLMQWALLEALRARRHTFVLGPEFRPLEPGDVVQWSSARNGYEDKLFRVDGIIYKSNLDVIVDLTEIDPADYDWDQEADYRPIIDGPLQLVGPRPMPMSGWQVFPATLFDNDGEGRRASIEVYAASGVPGVDRVRVQVRLGDENGDLVFDSDSQPYAAPWRWILQGQFVPLTTYAVRGIFVGPPAAEWSGWFSVTTQSVPDAFDIQVEQLGQELANAHGLVTGDQPGGIQPEIEALIQRMDDLATGVLQLGANVRENLKVLSVKQGGATAAVIRNERAIVEEGFARAEAITQILASVDEVIADGFLRFESEVDELSATATITAKVRASSGLDFSQAAWILKAEADGLGGSEAYFGVLGTFYVFDEVDGSPIPVFSATTDGVTFESGRFRDLTSIAEKSPGVPVVEIDGETGYFSYG